MKIGWQASNFHGYWKIAEEKDRSSRIDKIVPCQCCSLRLVVFPLREFDNSVILNP